MAVKFCKKLRPVSEKMLEERKVNFPRKDLSKLNINII